MSEQVIPCKHGRNFCMECHYQKDAPRSTLPAMYDKLQADYDALRAEAEALRKRARTAEREAAQALRTLKGLEKVARVVDTHSDQMCGENNLLRQEVEALRAENARLRQQLAQSDNALRESRANDMANVRTLEDMWERHDALQQELEAARGLLREVRQRCQLPDWARSQIDKLTATPATESTDHIEQHLKMVERGERQEAVAWTWERCLHDLKSGREVTVYPHKSQGVPIPPYTTPQPGQDVRALAEALKSADEYLSDNRFNEIGSGSILHRQMKDALAKYHQDT